MGKLSRKDKEIIALRLQNEQLRALLEQGKSKNVLPKDDTGQPKDEESFFVRAGRNWGRSYLSSLELPLSKSNLDKPVWIVNTNPRRISGSASYLANENNGIMVETTNPLEAKRFKDKQQAADCVMSLIEQQPSVLSVLDFSARQLNPNGTVN